MTFEEWIKKASLNPKKGFLSQEDLKKMYELSLSPPKMWTPVMDPGVKDESHLWEAPGMGEFVTMPSAYVPAVEDECTCLVCQYTKKTGPSVDIGSLDPTTAFASVFGAGLTAMGFKPMISQGKTFTAVTFRGSAPKDPLDQIAARFEEAIDDAYTASVIDRAMRREQPKVLN